MKETHGDLFARALQALPWKLFVQMYEHVGNGGRLASPSGDWFTGGDP